MNKKINYRESRGLPGGPNEQFTYVTGIFSTEGYKRNSPDVNNPFNIIPSGNITMQGVDFPVLGIDNKGTRKLMRPGKNYQFPGDMVFEIPVAQKGKEYNDATYAKARQEGRLYGLDPTTGDYYAPTLREAVVRPDIADKIYEGQNQFLSGALDLMSAPQKSMVELMTGKYQSPSEAMKITNPIGSFLIDAVLDPTNLVGAGLVRRGISSVKPNLLRGSINNIPIRSTNLFRPTGLNNTFNLEELRRVYHNSERFLQPEEARYLHKHGHGLRENYRIPDKPDITKAVEPDPTYSLRRDVINSGDSEVMDALANLVRVDTGVEAETILNSISDLTWRNRLRQHYATYYPEIAQVDQLAQTANQMSSPPLNNPNWQQTWGTDNWNPNTSTFFKPKPVNKSGLTKEEVLQKASGKDKDVVSKMSETEFENTVLKPNGEIVPYYQGSLEPQFTGSQNVIPLSLKEYVNEFNSRLDLLDDIIRKRNKSGIEYRAKGLDESGRLTFYTPQQSIPVKLTDKQKANIEWFTRDPKDWLINKAGLKQEGNIWKMSDEAGGDVFNSIEEAIESVRNKAKLLIEPKIISGESSWGVRINPGQWRGNVEDIANTEYFRSIPGLEMSNTTSGVFADNVPRKGTGAYESINEYLKKLDLGRVKPGFNSQTEFSRGAWENFIKSGRGVGFYGNPRAVYGTMKSVFPYLGAGYLGYEGLQGAGALQEKQYGGTTPIYVDDPKDARLKAYNDSLVLNNMSLKALNSFNKVIEPLLAKGKKNEAAKYWQSEMKDTPKVERAWKNLIKLNKVAPRGIMKESKYDSDFGVNIFKKPVQPYVYRNPEIIAKQQQLIDAGFDIGEVDGIWGKKSQAAWDEYTKQKEVKQPLVVENKPPVQTIIPRQKPQREYDNSNKPFTFLLGNAAYATYDEATAKDFARDLGIENPQRGNNKNIDPNTGLYREYNKATANKYSQKLKPLENGGELNVYQDYINGMYDGTSGEDKAKKIYDKLNRVYYKSAKELGMTPPNYIMSKLIMI